MVPNHGFENLNAANVSSADEPWMSASVGIDATLGKARDPARAHLLLQQRRRQAEAFGDDGGVDLDGAIFEFDRFHGLLLTRHGGVMRALD